MDMTRFSAGLIGLVAVAFLATGFNMAWSPSTARFSVQATAAMPKEAILKLAAPVVADSPVYTYTPAAISYYTGEVYHDYADTLAELKAAGRLGDSP
jgi:hypothetical protein